MNNHELTQRINQLARDVYRSRSLAGFAELKQLEQQLMEVREAQHASKSI